MGISGLLPLLKSIQRPTELKKYAGETLAVDAYGWLHRGAISCAVELAQGKPTRKYVDSVLNRVRMVQHFGVTPYLVFDGGYLPSKAATEASRAKRREDSRKAGQELIKAGNQKQAFLEFQKAIDITPEMARHLIEELKKLNLPYIVAPYEADAQMVYLERHGLVSGILSEDSDLLVFGAKRLLTKLDMHGHCIEINRREFCACREISLTDWTDREFRQMAILSGCDYLDSIGNIGLKTAYRMIRKHKTVEKVVRMLQFDGKFKVSENYLAAFRQAELTFLHQRVYCPMKKELVLLTEPTSGIDVDEMRFIGDKIDHDTARAIALGDVNPITKEPIVLPLSPGKKRRASSYSGAGSSPSQNQQPFGKPINEYFGKRRESAQRIPLGAMDPNCFSVDRQQVAALTQNGLAPRVFPLPRPYVDGGRTSLNQSPDSSRPLSSVAGGPRLRRRQTEPISSLLQLGSSPASTANTTNRRKTSSMLPPPPPGPPSLNAPQTTPSSARPQKKARLRLHTLDDSPPAKSFERSKYFPAASAFPGHASAPAKTKSTQTEGFLMSDDSVEDAMLSLPDFDDWDLVPSDKSAKTFVQVFQDTQVTGSDSTCPNQEAPAGTSSKDMTISDGSISGLAGDGVEIPASPAGKNSQPESKLLTGPADETPGGRLSLNLFSYAPSTQMVHGLPTPESSFAATQREETIKPTTASPPSTAGRRVRPRPGKGPRMSLSDLVEATSGARPARATQNSVKKVRQSMEASTPINPSFVPLPPANLEEVEALNRPQGSEDQIVPDSDVEDEEDGEHDEQAGTKQQAGSAASRLDLSRFLCI